MEVLFGQHVVRLPLESRFRPGLGFGLGALAEFSRTGI